MNQHGVCPFSNINNASQPIISYVREKLKIKYKKRRPQRAFHAKTIGIVKGQLFVNPKLEDEYKIGIFKYDTPYDVYIRFTNGSPNANIYDGKKTARGMAIKILNVQGDKFLDSDPYGKTQDIILFTSPIFTPNLAEDQLDGVKTVLGKFFEVITSGFKILSKYKGAAIRFINLANINSPNILEEVYYSGTPYSFGPHKAVKWQALPLKTITSTMPTNPSRNFLKERLVADLSPGSNYNIGFDLLVQFQNNPDTEPIEDCSVIWKSKPIEVAKIYIPQQNVESEEMEFLDMSLSYSPGHSLIEHAPLGSVNLMRRKIYQVLSSDRNNSLR